MTVGEKEHDRHADMHKRTTFRGNPVVAAMTWKKRDKLGFANTAVTDSVHLVGYTLATTTNHHGEQPEQQQQQRCQGFSSPSVGTV